MKSTVDLDRQVVQSFVYSDPDHLPPVINSSTILDKHGYRHNIIGHRSHYATMPEMEIKYPNKTVVQRHFSSRRRSLARFISFVVYSFTKFNKDASILIGHNAHGLITAWLVAMIYRRPYIYHCHDFTDYAAAKRLSEKIIKHLELVAARNAQFVIVPDKTRAEIIAQELNLRSFPIVVPNTPLDGPSGEKNLLKSELQRRNVDFERIVIRQGNVGPNHVLENVIRSIPMWSSPKWGFVILGPAKPDYTSQLLDLAESIGVGNRVALLPPVSYQDVKDYTVGAHLGHGMYEPFDVNGANNTTASNKVFEYMAAGLPIIISENPANQKFVESLQNGMTVNIYSPIAIAEAINNILSNEALAKLMGQRSKQAFLDKYNYSVQYAPVISRFRDYI